MYVTTTAIINLRAKGKETWKELEEGKRTGEKWSNHMSMKNLNE